MRKITTLAAFKKFLESYGIDWTTWGQGATKTVERLFHEYLSGESTFIIRRGKLIRVVKRVQVLVFYKSRKGIRWYLIEERQIFRNGSVRVRSRKRSLSEKMTPGESAKLAALRALLEELGITGIDAKLLKKLAPSRKGKPSDSDSYPGLPTIHYGPRFKISLLHAWFVRGGYDEVQSDKTTEFRWTKVRKRK